MLGPAAPKLALARAEVFDWVDRVSIELTTQMLSRLFDFPFEERRTLTRWSNVSAVNTRAGTEIDPEEKRDTVLQEMLAYLAEVWKIRLRRPRRTGNGNSGARDRVDRADAP